MADEDAVSSPSTDQASTQTEGPGVGLAAALDRAFDEVGLSEEKTEEKSTEAKVESPEGEEPKEKEPELGKPKEEVPPQAPKVAAPAQWDAAKKAQFDKLPDSAKGIVLDLAKSQEADYTRKTTELANVKRYAEAVSSLITDEHREQLRQAGLNEVQGFERLLQYQDYALRQPAAYLRWFAQAANLKPQAIFPEFAGARPAPQPGQPQGQPTNGAADPQIVQLQKAVHAYGQWINQAQQREQNDLRERQTQSARQAQSVVDRFRAAVDSDGQPTYPYFNRVEEKMTKILQTDPDINAIEDQMERLKEAYEASIARDKELRTEAGKAEAARQRSAEQRQKDVAKAKAAAPPINAPAQAGDDNISKLSLKDQVDRQMVGLGL